MGQVEESLSDKAACSCVVITGSASTGKTTIMKVHQLRTPNQSVLTYWLALQQVVCQLEKWLTEPKQSEKQAIAAERKRRARIERESKGCKKSDSGSNAEETEESPKASDKLGISLEVSSRCKVVRRI